jgi:K+-transporting ATPase ATPase A chain
MTAIGWAQIGLFFVVVVLLTRPLGSYMFRVFEGEKRPLPSVFGRAERFLYRLCGVDPAKEQTWPVYAFSSTTIGFCSGSSSPTQSSGCSTSCP